MTNFEAMIKVPVAPLLDRINHDLNVIKEEREQIDLAYALSRNETRRYEDLLKQRYALYDQISRMEEFIRNFEHNLQRRILYTPPPSYDYLYYFQRTYESPLRKIVRDQEYIKKITAIQIACNNSPDGFVYIHDMKTFDEVGKFVITPDIMKIGYDDVEIINQRCSELETRIFELKIKSMGIVPEKDRLEQIITVAIAADKKAKEPVEITIDPPPPHPVEDWKVSSMVLAGVLGFILLLYYWAHR